MFVNFIIMTLRNLTKNNIRTLFLAHSRYVDIYLFIHYLCEKKMLSVFAMLTERAKNHRIDKFTFLQGHKVLYSCLAIICIDNHVDY